MKKYVHILFALLFSSQVMAQESPISVAFGTLPEASQVKKIVSAGNPSDVVLLAVAPEKLAGFAGVKLKGEVSKQFPTEIQKLEILGKVSGKNSTLSPEKLVALQPDLIIDIGNVTPNYLDQADKTQKQTQIPYVLLDGKLTRTPELLREMGKLTGNVKQAEALASYAEKVLQGGEKTADFAKTAYLARGADGLQTGLMGSIHTEAMELAGFQNVAVGEHRGLTKVSMEQILHWNPAVIFTQYPEFYQQVWTNPQWQNVAAVKNKQVYLVPHQPFGWLDSPPSLNRLLGIKWLQHLSANKPQADFVPEIQQFYQLFYHISLSVEQANALLMP